MSSTCPCILHWEGTDNFAVNADATVNWTGGPGHFTSAEERARFIRSKGGEWIEKMKRDYLTVRLIYDPIYGENDVFRKYKIEHLLA